jgi:hypothetical protein
VSITLERPSAMSDPTHAGVPTAPLAMRLAGVAALGGIFYVHLQDLSSKLDEVPYLGWGYIGLMIGVALAAVALLVPRGDVQRLGWLAGGGLALTTAIGFTLTRTTGLPQASDDIGNWGEALGVWSLICEGAFAVLAAAALSTTRRRAIA